MKGKLLLLSCLFFFFAANSFLFAQQLTPAVVWKKCFGGSSDDKANSILVTPDGGFIIAGYTTSTDGDLSSVQGSGRGWILKISATGSIIWQLRPGDEINTVIRLADGNFMGMGTAGGDLYLVKFSSHGTVIWNKTYGGSATEYPGNVTENHDGTLYLVGTTMSFDGDVTGRHGTDIYDHDIWVLKLNSDGSIIWERCFGGTWEDNGYNISESDNGSFLLAMESEGIDGDFGNVGGVTPRGAIAKIDSNKSVIWLLNLQGSLPIAMIPNGDVYDVNTAARGCSPMQNNLAATQWEFTNVPSKNYPNAVTRINNYTFCPGQYPVLHGYKTVGSSGIARVNATDHLFAGSSDDSITYTGFHGGIFDGFISGYKNNTGISFTKFLGGTGDDEFTSVQSIDPYNFIIAGFTNSNDGDVTGNHGSYDVWIIKMGRVNTIKGTVYQDYNQNNVRDPNEPLVNNIIVQSQKGLSKSASSTYNGFFDNTVDTGSYTTSVLSNLLYYTPSPASISSSFGSYNLSDSISFALQPIPGKRDYALSMWNFSIARPGFQSLYRLYITNKGTDTLSNKQVSLMMDSRMQLLSSAPAQTSISGNTINWTIPSLSPRDTTSILVVLQASPPPALNLNDTLIFSAVIDSAGDVNPVDNVTSLKQWVWGAFDPNDIEEVHAGSIPLQEVTQGSDLLYTIRFQNTGNDTAFTVVVRDTLESRITASSVEMVSASHPYRLTIQDSSILIWTFDNILLPDSIHNEPKSHGYVSYRVKPRNNLATGDMIKNTSSVYFDFNLPVQTNTEVTIVTKDLPVLPAPLLSALDSFFCSSSANQPVKILNLPPASPGMTVLVQLDTIHNLSVGADSAFTFVPANLGAGNHSVKVTFTDSTGQHKSTSLYFALLGEPNPSLALSASQTIVGAGTDPVIITATGQIGSRQTALFTFARDYSLNHIIQSQSTSNILSLPSSALSIGDNWIFVKMSAAPYHCQTVQPAIDSIKISRKNSTGLIDPDFPDEPVNISPNPFDSRLTISGLSIDKQYELIIYSSTGRKVLAKSIVHQSVFTTGMPFLAKGVYALWFYDLSKGRLIGTVSMLKQ